MSSSSSSSSAVPKKIGKLVFKGGNKEKKPLKAKSSGTYNNSNSNSNSDIVHDGTDDNYNDNDDAGDDELKIETGTGKISTSSNTVHGTDTKFLKELAVGDAIIVVHPITLRDETKIVKMVLSDVSMSISSAFSSDLSTAASFSYIKCVTARETQQQAAERAAKERAKEAKQEEQALGTYGKGGGDKFVYRVKHPSSFGGYKIVTETVGSKSREELLIMRSKKKSDKFCV